MANCKNTSFSIVVPVFNTEKYIDDCVQSILDQDYESLELILVDDGSTDGSAAIIDSYANADERVTAIHKENGGLVSARKRGAQLITGDYTVVVDSDDWLEPGCLRHFADIIEKTNADVVLAGYNKVCSEEKVCVFPNVHDGFYTEDSIKKELYPLLLENKLGKNIQHNIWGRAIKSNLYIRSQMMVPENISIGEDRCVIVPVIMDCMALYVTKVSVYNYRYNPGSMTNARVVYDLDYPANIYTYFHEIHLLEGDLAEQLNRKCVHDLFNAVESQFNNNLDKKKTYKDIDAALSREICKNILQETRFKIFTKGWLAQILLNGRFYGLISLINRRHN